jgi:hypothetical protein
MLEGCQLAYAVKASSLVATHRWLSTNKSQGVTIHFWVRSGSAFRAIAHQGEKVTLGNVVYAAQLELAPGTSSLLV